jgi:hypothetical protein
MCFKMKQHKLGVCITPTLLCLVRRASECQHPSHASKLVNSTRLKPIGAVEVGFILHRQSSIGQSHSAATHINAQLQDAHVFGTWTTHGSSDSAALGTAAMTTRWGC